MTDFLSCLLRGDKFLTPPEKAVWNACELTGPRVNVNEQTDSLFGNERLGEGSTSPLPAQDSLRWAFAALDGEVELLFHPQSLLYWHDRLFPRRLPQRIARTIKPVTEIREC